MKKAAFFPIILFAVLAFVIPTLFVGGVAKDWVTGALAGGGLACAVLLLASIYRLFAIHNTLIEISEALKKQR